MHGDAPTAKPDGRLDEAVARARDALLPDGHWVFELEVDAATPAKYVLLQHSLNRIEPELEQKIGVYLRSWARCASCWLWRRTGPTASPPPPRSGIRLSRAMR